MRAKKDLTGMYCISVVWMILLCVRRSANRCAGWRCGARGRFAAGFELVIYFGIF